MSLTSMWFILVAVLAFIAGAVCFPQKAKADRQTMKEKLVFDLFWLKVGLDDVQAKAAAAAPSHCKNRAQEEWANANNIYCIALADVKATGERIEYSLENMVDAYQALANARAFLEELDKDEYDRDPRGCHGKTD